MNRNPNPNQPREFPMSSLDFEIDNHHEHENDSYVLVLEELLNDNLAAHAGGDFPVESVSNFDDL